MHVRKYDMMMLVRHAKDGKAHGDGQTRHERYQRRTVVVWVVMSCPISYQTRSELARARV